MDKTRPFTFLDHALKCGDSLLGISRFKQLETFSLDDEHAKQVIILSNYDELIQTAIAKRRELEMLPSNDPAQIATKKALLSEAEERMERLKLAADLLIAAELTDGNEKKKEMARAAAHMKVTEHIQEPIGGFRRFVHDQLPTHRTLHWPLEFPEVIQGGGFNAFIGNPPFKAGRYLSAEFGRNYLTYLQSSPYFLRGQADYCAAFASRAFSLCRNSGIAGLITTKTISEGDTREAFLNKALRSGGRLIWVASLVWWPGAAQVVVSLMVVERPRSRVQAVLDGARVQEIDATFAPVEIIRDAPEDLVASSRLVGKGVGLGADYFVLGHLEGLQLQSLDPKHVRRYISGVEHNAAVDGWGGRFVFFFQDVASEQALEALASGQAFLARLRMEDRNGDYWRYRRSADGTVAILRKSKFCIIRAQTSSTWSFSFWPKDDVFDQSIIVFGSNCEGLWSVLNSSIHEAWAAKYGRLMKTDTAYAPSDSFNNFALPYDPMSEENATLAKIARELSEIRTTVERSRGGKTQTWADFHDPTQNSDDLKRLRSLHVTIDEAVLAAYGWAGSVNLEHDFHETKQGVRFTISESTRRNVLDRLLALNQQRYEEEVCTGLHERKSRATTRTSGKKKPERAARQGELL